MKLWWLLDSRRLGIEKRAVEAIADRVHWFSLDRWTHDHGRLSAVGTITAHHHPYPIRLIYPDQFPLVPAWVEPQEDVRWSNHQYGKSTLCLELRPDNWTPSATGAEVLKSAFSLLETEDPLGKGGQSAPSDHQTAEAQFFGEFNLPAFIGEGCLERLRSGSSEDVVALRWMRSESTLPVYIHDAVDRLASHRPPDEDVEESLMQRPLYISSHTGPKAAVDRASIVEAGGWDEKMREEIRSVGSAEIIFLGGSSPEIFCTFHEKTHRRGVYTLPEEAGVRSGASSRREGRQVSIVGVGSVGSKIAESLTRAGVQRLKLIDGDIMMPGNIERHALDWRDVGSRKLHSLKRRLLSIRPGSQVETIQDNLNWQRSSRTHAWQVEALAEADLIVDATGDPASALFLGAIAEANGCAFVSVEVFEGGIGGLIALTLSTRDPPFAEGRARFLNWCNQNDVDPPEPGPGNYEAISGDGLPVVADDASVSIVSGHAARVVLDTLDDDPPVPECSWLLVGLTKAWLFEGQGHTIRLDVGRRQPDEPVEKDPEAEELASKIFKEIMDAD